MQSDEIETGEDRRARRGRLSNDATACAAHRLCADDYGISPGVNEAIRDLIARGRINATSVMVVAPVSHPTEATALTALKRDAPHRRSACISR